MTIDKNVERVKQPMFINHRIIIKELAERIDFLVSVRPFLSTV